MPPAAEKAQFVTVRAPLSTNLDGSTFELLEVGCGPGGDTATYAAGKGFGVLGSVGGEAKDFG